MTLTKMWRNIHSGAPPTAGDPPPPCQEFWEAMPGADPATEEVRRALWEHAPIPVDLLLLEASDLDPEVLLPRLILGP